MKIVVAPDAFKGTLAAKQAAAAIAKGIRRAMPHANILEMPMADGGEGTMDVLLPALNGRRRWAWVSGCNGEPLRAGFATFTDTQGRETALIEAARIVGVNLPTTTSAPLMQRTSFGVGELIRLCLDRGLCRFVIALGGSGSNDGGAGLLAALGVRLLDAKGEVVLPHPQGLQQLARIDASGLDRRLRQSRIEVLADVDNPLCGANGATAVYGPQKGLAADRITAVDEVLAHYADCCASAFGVDARDNPGAGAAGGIGYALQLLGARMYSGAEQVATILKLDQALSGADWLVTGEGCADAQTLAGKAPMIAARLARRQGVATCLLAGRADKTKLSLFNKYFDLVIEATPEDKKGLMNPRDAARFLRLAAAKLTARLS